MKIIKELMQKFPPSCSKNESIETIAFKMSDTGLHFLPVINSRNEVVGSVTYQDIYAAIEKNKVSVTRKLVVANVMRAETCSVSPYDDEAQALRLMRRDKTPYLPVVDDNNHLKGMVSFMALARRVIQLKNDLRRDMESFRILGEPAALF